jgi:hypothetical protein
LTNSSQINVPIGEDGGFELKTMWTIGFFNGVAFTLLVVFLAVLYFGIHVNNGERQTVICPPNTFVFTIEVDGHVSCGADTPSP